MRSTFIITIILVTIFAFYKALNPVNKTENLVHENHTEENTGNIRDYVEINYAKAEQFQEVNAEEKNEVVVKDDKENENTNGFVQVIDGCEIVLNDCLNVRSGPGTEYRKVYSLRIGAIVEIDKKVVGDDGRIWYRIKQDSPLKYPGRVKGDWYIAASYVKFVFPPNESSYPVENTDKRIVIDISEQKLRAYKGDELVMETLVSTGLPGTETLRGEFEILSKKPSRYMQGPLSGMSDFYDLPGVPWVMFFHWNGSAIHGAYWHNDFGKKRSHGCVNLPIDKSEELYRWAEIGTKVIVED